MKRKIVITGVVGLLLLGTGLWQSLVARDGSVVDLSNEEMERLQGGGCDECVKNGRHCNHCTTTPCTRCMSTLFHLTCHSPAEGSTCSPAPSEEMGCGSKYINGTCLPFLKKCSGGTFTEDFCERTTKSGDSCL